jgi:hypothetical protein
MMERILQDIPFAEPEELDTLLEVAETVRELIRERREDDLSALIQYTVRHSYYEAFAWAIGILEECFGKDASMPEMQLELGGVIPDFREFMSRLQVDLKAVGNDVQTVPDEHGEIQSFFNILRYQTGFAHLELVTSENYDSRDNDYIRYLLVCRAG